MTQAEDRVHDERYPEMLREALAGGRLHQLFNLQGANYTSRGGSFEGDPYPEFHRLRESGPVHEGIVGPLVGYHGEAWFQGLPFPERPHFSAFDFATCDLVFRDHERFSSSPHAHGSEEQFYESTLLYMDGDRHRRYRMLVQPSFAPRQIEWWLDRWIRATVNALVDRLEGQDRADLSIELFAPIPLLTICGSFGVDAEQALDIREAVISDGLGFGRFFEIVGPLVPARRERAEDDLISVLVRAELTDEDGTHVLSDEEVLGFAFLLLAAGSGTTWKQMGITTLALLSHPEWLEAARNDPAVLRRCIDEAVRWTPTDPVFARFATEDVTLGGLEIPKGAVVHMCLGAANRDPERWERPDEFDPSRPPQQHLGFGNGHHICLGMHVAKAEIHTAISTLLQRLPNLALDANAEAPQITGMYERGPTAVPVVFT